MISGITTEKMKMEIQCIHTSEPNLLGVYGFGSFFRSEKYNDCDLLLVIDNDCSCLGKIHAELYERFFDLGKRLSVVFDLTILTEREHRNKPLREHNELIAISVRSCQIA